MRKNMIPLTILFLGFFLDITGFFRLVESPGLLSIDALWFGIFLIVYILYWKNLKSGPIVALVFIIIWIWVQYISHWKYTIFGASIEKIVSYNNYFANTYHVIPASEKIIIPDTYHIILHLLLVINFIYLCKVIIVDRKKLR